MAKFMKRRAALFIMLSIGPGTVFALTATDLLVKAVM